MWLYLFVLVSLMPVRGILDSTLVELGYRLVPILQYNAFYFDIVVLIYIQKYREDR